MVEYVTASRCAGLHLTRLSMFRYETTTVRVPVPEGQEERAAQIAQLLSRQAQV